MFAAVGLRGLGSVLACLGLNLMLGGSHAASVTEGLDILFTCLAGLGRTVYQLDGAWKWRASGEPLVAQARHDWCGVGA